MAHLLSDILDQRTAIEAIARAYQSDHLPHGLLFAGPVGVGKATTASALAKLFLCPSAQADRPCDRCDSCRLFDAGTHPDFRVITKELIRYHDKTGKSKGIELSIQVLRPELIEPASRKPTLGHGKAFVIEQAELMNLTAQNAILKTLEEPAGRSLIVLLTDQPLSLLATIRSRCQMFVFGLLQTTTIETELARRGKDPEAAKEAARLSAGSLGLALKWIEDGVIPLAGQLQTRMANPLQDEDSSGLSNWFRSAADAYAARQLERDELSSKDQATREGLALYFRLAADYFRQQLAATAGAEDAAQLRRACTAIEAFGRAEMYLDANVNVAILLQQLAMKL